MAELIQENTLKLSSEELRAIFRAMATDMYLSKVGDLLHNYLYTFLDPS